LLTPFVRHVQQLDVVWLDKLLRQSLPEALPGVVAQAQCIEQDAHRKGTCRLQKDAAVGAAGVLEAWSHC
jgi:hypothetical protein